MMDKSTGHVVVRDGDQVIARVALEGARMVIGRTEQADVQLPANTVSREHAELFSDPFGRWWVRDLGSRNGTLIDGQKVDEHLLEPDDRIGIEHFTIQVELDGPAKTRRRPTAVTGSSVTIADMDAGGVSRLDAIKPKIDASHLKILTRFSSTLLQTEDDDQRLKQLCELMVGKDFRGNQALAMRLARDSDGQQQPDMLCEPVSGKNWRSDESPYISRTMVRTVLESGEPVVASNVGGGSGDVVEMSLAAAVQEMSAIMCPIGGDDGAMDVLYVSFPAEYASDEWLALAALAAEQFQQAAAAWDARRRAEQQAVLEKDLQQAERIQSSLIPLDAQVDGLDLAFGFVPCRWVGGDYVDILPMPDGRVFVAIYDVCGKGMQAALITASLHTLVHMNATLDLPLADIVGRMNDYLVDTLPDESFATGITMMLDPKTGKFESCNAGHPPALIAASDGSVRQLPVAKNPPLGYMPLPYETDEGELGEGEMLALFTDGYTELPNEANELLGIEGVEACLGKVYKDGAAVPVKDVSDRFRHALHEHQGNAPAMDDLTFIIVRRK
jgi:serine phosphatase RsbU (regulator of sigma subunit)/pSer/pThr/pTyr-binding forkhead associated (FHA) protein